MFINSIWQNLEKLEKISDGESAVHYSILMTRHKNCKHKPSASSAWTTLFINPKIKASV